MVSCTTLYVPQSIDWMNTEIGCYFRKSFSTRMGISGFSFKVFTYSLYVHGYSHKAIPKIYSRLVNWNLSVYACDYIFVLAPEMDLGDLYPAFIHCQLEVTPKMILQAFVLGKKKWPVSMIKHTISEASDKTSEWSIVFTEVHVYVFLSIHDPCTKTQSQSVL